MDGRSFRSQIVFFVENGACEKRWSDFVGHLLGLRDRMNPSEG
jgi:hypothetical protein